MPEKSLALRAQENRPPSFGPGDKVALPAPFATPFNTKQSRVIGWPAGRTPNAPSGFRVSAFAEGLKNPRSLYLLPNGDVLVAESIQPSSAPPREAFGQITLLRDANKDGVAEIREAFLTTGLNLPFGMALIRNRLYIGNHDSVIAFPYETGQTKMTASPARIMELPRGGHYTRNLIANADGSKLYIAVGAATDANQDGNAEKEPQRAAILEINPDGSGLRVFAGGIRNPVGMSWEPTTRMLWTVVNERNTLGDDLVPDYATSVREGGFYGWPWAYFGRNPDPLQKGQHPELVAKTLVPDFALGAHSSSLGLVFYQGTSFPSQYRGGAFIGQHGSNRRASFAGFRVLFLPFRNGKPTGDAEDFLTGFIANAQSGEVYGRPVGLAVLADGSLLVADDGGNKIWRVSHTDATRSAASR